MKKGLLVKWGFLLAIGLIFVTGQAMGAGMPDFLCELSVEGTIVEVCYDDRYIEVDPHDGSDNLKFKGIPIEYLELLLGSLVNFEVIIYYHECPNLIEFKACSIEIVDCGLDNCLFDLPVRPGHGNRIPQGPKNGAGNGKGGP